MEELDLLEHRFCYLKFSKILSTCYCLSRYICHVPELIFFFLIIKVSYSCSCGLERKIKFLVHVWLNIIVFG